jgi:hypothetical protein
MDYPTIKQLVNKYWEGSTTLEEEAQLRAYFNGTQVDPRLKNVQPLFVFFKQEQQRKSQRPLRLWEMLRPKRHWGLVAASVALLIAIGVWYSGQQAPEPTVNLAVNQAKGLEKDTYEDPQKAFEEAKEALMRLSKGLNKGVEKTRKGLEQARD